MLLRSNRFLKCLCRPQQVWRGLRRLRKSDGLEGFPSADRMGKARTLLD